MYDEVTLHVCPNHCGAHFDVTVHVTQDWEVDAEGNFEKALNEAVEVTHGPQDDDCWDAPSAELRRKPFSALLWSTTSRFLNLMGLRIPAFGHMCSAMYR